MAFFSAPLCAILSSYAQLMTLDSPLGAECRPPSCPGWSSSGEGMAVPLPSSRCRSRVQTLELAMEGFQAEVFYHDARTQVPVSRAKDKGGTHAGVGGGMSAGLDAVLDRSAGGDLPFFQAVNLQDLYFGLLRQKNSNSAAALTKTSNGKNGGLEVREN